MFRNLTAPSLCLSSAPLLLHPSASTLCSVPQHLVRERWLKIQNQICCAKQKRNPDLISEEKVTLDLRLMAALCMQSRGSASASLCNCALLRYDKPWRFMARASVDGGSLSPLRRVVSVGGVTGSPAKMSQIQSASSSSTASPTAAASPTSLSSSPCPALSAASDDSAALLTVTGVKQLSSALWGSGVYTGASYIPAFKQIQTTSSLQA